MVAVCMAGRSAVVGRRRRRCVAGLDPFAFALFALGGGLLCGLVGLQTLAFHALEGIVGLAGHRRVSFWRLSPRLAGGVAGVARRLGLGLGQRLAFLALAPLGVELGGLALGLRQARGF